MRILKYSISLLFLLVVLIGAFFPMILSSPWGQEQLRTRVNDKIPGSFSFDKIELAWLGPQHIENLKLLDPNGDLVVSIPKLDTEASLLGLMRGSNKIGKTEAHSPKMQLILYEEGDTNIDRALGKTTKTPRTTTPPSQSKHSPSTFRIPVVGSLLLTDGSFQIEQPFLPPIKVSNIDITAESPTQQGPFKATISALTTQGGGEGKLFLDVFMDGFTSKGRLPVKRQKDGVVWLSNKAQIKLISKVENLPVKAIDAVIELNNPLARDLYKEMLGETLNLDMTNTVTAKGWSIDLDLDTQHLKAKIAGTTQEETFTLSRAGEINFHVRPSYFQAFATANEWEQAPELMQPVDLFFQLRRLSFPFRQGFIKLSDLTADFDLQASSTAFKLADLKDPFAMEGLRLTFKTEQLKQGLFVDAQTKGMIGADPVNLDLQGEVKNLFDESGKLHFITSQGSFDLESQNLPVQLIDRLSTGDGSLLNLLGTTASIDGSFEGKLNDLILAMRLQSQRLQIDQARFRYTDKLEMIDPILAQGTITPALFADYAGGTVRLLQPTQAKLELQELAIDEQDWTRSAAKGTISLSIFEAEGLDNVTGISGFNHAKIEEAILTFDAHPFSDTDLTLTGNLSSNEMPTWMRLFAGDVMQVRMDGNLQQNDAWHLPSFTAQINSDTLQTKLIGSIDEKRKLKFDQPVELKWILSPHHFAAWSTTTQLLSPSPLQLSIEPFSISLADPDIDFLRIKGSGYLPKMEVEGVGRPLYASIEDLSVTWSADFATGIARAKSEGYATTTRGGEKGAMTFGFSSSGWRKDEQWSFDEADLTAMLKMQTLPMAVVEMLSGQEGLTTYFGQSVQASFEGEFESFSPPRGKIDLDLIGEGIALKGEWDVTPEKIVMVQQDEPAGFHWTLSPERWAALQPDVPFELVKNCDVTLLLQEFESLFTLHSTKVRGFVRVEDFQAKHEQSDQAVTFQQMIGSVASNQLGEFLKAELEGLGTTAEGKSAQIKVDAEFEKILLPDDTWNWEGMRSKVEGRIEHAPVALLSVLAGLGQQGAFYLETVLGKTVSAVGAFSRRAGRGQIAARASSPNAELNLQGKLTDGVLELTDTLDLKVRVSEDSSRRLLRAINPILVSAVSGQDPIRLQVAASGSRMQVIPLSWSSLNFNQAVVELGKMRVENRGPMSAILSILSRGNLFGSVDKMEAWFTPQYMSATNGKIRMDRMDALLDNRLHIITWGFVDIPGDKVDMTLGIAGSALKNSIGISGLPQGYFLQTSMKGPLDDVDIDVGSAVAQIALMRTGKSIGPLGDFLGGVLGGVKSKRVPPKRTDPLPWGDLEVEEKNDSPDDLLPTPKPDKPGERIRRIFDIFDK